MSNPRRAIKAVLQRLVFAYERFGEHELANHAAAGAYAFLLSATPAVLLIIALASALLSSAPAAMHQVERLLGRLFGPLDAAGLTQAFFDRPLGGLAAVIGAASLVWAARLFVVTIQRGLRIIWAAAGRNPIVKENVLGFGLELAALFAVVAALAAIEALRALAHATVPLVGPGIASAFRAAARLGPAALLLLIVYGSYRYAPSSRPRRRVAFYSALLCVVAFIGFSEVFRFFIATARYELLYGVFARLIILLANVYVFFSLYFYCAELAYVGEHFDSLLFGRYQTMFRSPGSPRIERALFMDPARLIRCYGKEYAAGQVVFAYGDGGRASYFVHRGRIGIYRRTGEGEERLASLGSGELFGEMAHILDESRTATARAEEVSLLLELPPAVFETYLRSDPVAVRRLADMLAARLKEADLRIAGGATGRDDDRTS